VIYVKTVPEKVGLDMLRNKKCLWILVLVTLLVLTGCKVELYSDLNEKEANEMLAILLQTGIDGNKIAGKEMTWGLHVDKADIARAVAVLQQAGYPKDRFVSIGDIFKKEGLVSSPLEERVRFIYALSQEISETLSHIDGVLVARTQIVLPKNDPLSDNLQPSSASVFIKHRPESDLEENIPRIKKLVVNSIEGLTYEKVTIVLFPAEAGLHPSQQPEFDSVFGIAVASHSRGRLWVIIGSLLALSACAILFAGFVFLGRRSRHG
jgi:type III secretion protein J